METNKYIVWVGGIPNYFNSLLEAQTEVLKWINKGYDDIKTERIKKSKCCNDEVEEIENEYCELKNVCIACGNYCEIKI